MPVSRFWTHGTIDRSTYDAIADPACGRARIIQPAATLQDLLIAPCEGRPRQTRSETSGELDAQFRLKDQIDKPGSDDARGLWTVRRLSGR